ncbi:MAG TPA: hypothetical protein VMS22_21320 [Candidatus Eisenbacteria bacterium]|nr:hypothetical protein [Candidatus Eisenbacteria bacterium]
MPKPAQVEKECCARTRARWEKRIRMHYSSFPVIKDVPCDRCRQILEIRVFDDQESA